MYNLYKKYRVSRQIIVNLRKAIIEILYYNQKNSNVLDTEIGVKVDDDFAKLLNEVSSRGGHESARPYHFQLEARLQNNVEEILEFDMSVLKSKLPKIRRLFNKFRREKNKLYLIQGVKEKLIISFIESLHELLTVTTIELAYLDDLLSSFDYSYKKKDGINILFKRHSPFDTEYPTVVESQKSIAGKKRILSGFGRLVKSNEDFYLITIERGSWIEILNAPPAVAVSIASILSGVMYAVKTGLEIYKLHLETKKMNLDSLNDHVAGLLESSKSQPLKMAEKLAQEAFKLNPYEGADKNEVENHVRQSIKDLISFVSNNGELRFDSTDTENQKLLEGNQVDEENYLELLDLSKQVSQISGENTYHKLLEEG